MIGVCTAGVYGPHAGRDMRDCTLRSWAGGAKRMKEDKLKLRTSSAKDERACNGAPRGLQCRVWVELGLDADRSDVAGRQVQPLRRAARAHVRLSFATPPGRPTLDRQKQRRASVFLALCMRTPDVAAVPAIVSRALANQIADDVLCRSAVQQRSNIIHGNQNEHQAVHLNTPQHLAIRWTRSLSTWVNIVTCLCRLSNNNRTTVSHRCSQRYPCHLKRCRIDISSRTVASTC